MFPIDTANKCYDEACVSKFDAVIREMGYSWDIRQLLPEVLAAGDFAGSLTEDGAYFLDPTGTLRAGIPTVPPEGDAGTGMTATNAVRMFTGNVSANVVSLLKNQAGLAFFFCKISKHACKQTAAYQ